MVNLPNVMVLCRALSLIALKTATLSSSFEFSFSILIPGMCQTCAVRKPTVPNCSLVFSCLSSHCCIQRTSLFLTLKVQGQAVPSSAVLGWVKISYARAYLACHLPLPGENALFCRGSGGINSIFCMPANYRNL